MKRKAILIGNTSGLPGVKVDLRRFSGFLASNTGGAWYTHEIEVHTDVARVNLVTRLTQLKNKGLDYAVVLFSGHGGQFRKETVLELNKSGETIEESVLRGLAPRQLTIFDCCRCYLEPIQKAESVERMQAAFMESASSVRFRYESRIMQAVPQQAQLYSCSVGQVSYDTPDGGIYLTNLLKAASKFDNKFKLVGAAHEEAQGPTFYHSLTKNDGRQTPECVLPKCLSQQQLILSIKG
ncbi:caspase family protein [Geomonas sp. Red32]|uniref:caspase family protein n=1 Tax=Geomonas sp. Red32 TaxID=2912856 RepID=UPI00202CE546|nr:caspase family protein [Geomonas sp. Red32]